MPLVSIIIPAYNASRYICEAVDSCLAQTYPNCEVIVVDDGSTDGTGELLKQRYGESIRYVVQENGGPSSARNHGVRESHGEFIQFCDADDRLHPEKIRRCVEVFQQHGNNIGVVYTRLEFVGGGTLSALDSHRPLPSGNVFCELLHGRPIQTGTALIRRAAITGVGLWRDDYNLRCADDWDLFLRLASQYEFVGIDEPLLLYRRHTGNITNDPYCMAKGRLLAVQLARGYPGRERCFDDADYDRLEAARHHVLGAVCWQTGRRAEARHEFREAIRLDPAHSRMRRVYLILSYLLPGGTITLIEGVVRVLKKLPGQ